MSKFYASDICILRFSYDPDLTGGIVPPECHCVLPTKIPVMFDSPTSSPVGWAYLKKKKAGIFADLELESTHKPAREALRLISYLFPAACFTILDAHEETVLQLKMVALLLTPNGNMDPRIPELGKEVRQAKEDLN